MASISFSGPALVFTDRDRVAGGIITEASGGVGTPVSGDVIAMIEKNFFNKNKTELGDLNALAASAQAGGGGQGIGGLAIAPQADPQTRKSIRRLAVTVPGMRVTNKNPRLGTVQERSFDSDGKVTLGGRSIWRPKGKMQTRKVGPHTVHFVVSDESLQGQVSRVGGIEQFVLAQGTVEGEGCGVCGVCGACALCGELNAGSAAASLVAISAIFTVETVDPQDAAKINEHLAAIQRIAANT